MVTISNYAYNLYQTKRNGEKMKKIIAIMLTSVILVSALSGCSRDKAEPAVTEVPIEYVTKYVTNIEKLDVREQPSNGASIICSIDKNSPVSFVEDSHNGYSKVVYNGVTGYALSSYLTKQEPVPEYANENTTSVNDVQGNDYVQKRSAQTSENNNRTYSIISNRSESEIEDYIVSYVRPLYNEVNSNLNNYTASVSNGVKYWHDGKGYIKKVLSPSVNNYAFAREYYYDTDSGRIAFAFVYNDAAEYRLYFRTNQLVRFIYPDGSVVNNPKNDEALRMGEYVLSEAYQ